LKGQLLIWTAAGWQVIGSDYCDFNWVTVEDVKSFFEGLGFNFVFNELLTPLALEYLSGVAPRASFSVPECDSSSEVGPIIGYSTSPTNVTLTVGSAGSGYGLSGDWGTAPNYLPGSCLRFQTAAAAAGANWKVRQPVAAGAAPVLADVKNWTGHAPVFMSAFGVGGFNPSGSNSDPVSGISITGDLTAGVGQNPGWPLSNPYVSPGCPWEAMALDGVDEFVKGPVGEGTIYQFATLGIFARNSAAVAGLISVRTVPTGCWNFDGDFWSSSMLNYVKADWFWQQPNKWFAAAGDELVAVAGRDGLSVISAPAGSAAYALLSSTVNLLSLAALGPAVTIDEDTTPIDEDTTPL
jgi:hypothetical protein